MISATLSTAFDTEPSTGATEPMLIQKGGEATVYIYESTATLVATFNIEVIPVDQNKDKPNMNDSRWVIDKIITVISSTPSIKVSDTGAYWVRVVIPSGGYTSGEADVRINRS